MVNTGRVTDRRTLCFGSIDDVLADAARLVDAERSGALRRSGNWTLGQALGHIAAWIDFGYTGYPPGFRVPWIVRKLSRLMKRKFLESGLQPGLRFRGVEGGTLGTEPLDADEGIARFRRQWERLRKGPPEKPNGVFGPLSHQEWIALHLRHAELHLSFFHPS